MCLITLRLMLPYTFLHVPGILETLQKMRCANISFQESIVARKLERIWMMYFYQGSLSLLLSKWDVALATIFVFSTNEQVDCYFF